MRTQQDLAVRVVSLDNLKAMCEHFTAPEDVLRPAFGDFWVEKVTRSRVWVGTVEPMGSGEWAGDPDRRYVYAILPCYPMKGEPDNPRVVLDLMRIVGGDSESWQAFTPLWDVTSMRNGLEGAEWKAYRLPDDDSASFAHTRVIHRAYHAVEGGTENCHVCQPSEG